MDQTRTNFELIFQTKIDLKIDIPKRELGHWLTCQTGTDFELTLSDEN